MVFRSRGRCGLHRSGSFQKSGADSDEVKIKRAATVSAVERNGVLPFADTFVKSVLSEETLSKKPHVLESAAALVRGNSALGVCGSLMAMAARTDTTASLSGIRVPALVCVGE